ncbi:MAG: hypothetical protein QM764_04100 [Chitinophagaceae bacterium]
MKKALSIVFLMVLIFNCCGYRWVLSYLQNKSTIRLAQTISSGKYDKKLLVEVKIPLNLPYLSNWAEYRDYDGEIEIDGKNFEFVKRKFINDTLYLLCIAHTEKDILQLAKSDYFKAVNNLQQDGPQKNNVPNAPRLVLSDYLPQDELAYIFYTENNLLSYRSKNNYFISQFQPSTAGQPPEFLV